MNSTFQNNHTLRQVNSTQLPAKENISSVHAVILNGGKIVAIKNKRGWDIPGGHVEENETFDQALRREIAEEAGLELQSPLHFILVLTPDYETDTYQQQSMLFAVAQTEDTPPHGQLMTASEFIDVYSQDAFHEVMVEVLTEATHYEF